MLTWFKTTQPLLNPINVKLALSRLILSRHHNKSSGLLGAVVDVGGGVWRSGVGIRSGDKSDAIVGSELHESSLQEKLI